MIRRLTLPLLCLLPYQVQAGDVTFPLQPTRWQLTLPADLSHAPDHLTVKGLSEHFMLRSPTPLPQVAEQVNAAQASLQPYERAYQQQRKTLHDRCGSGLQSVAAKRSAAHGTVSLAPCADPLSGIWPLQRQPGIAIALPE
ncbi:hypothetical protein THUN1379_10420 [Paludibacterium sp. THUN1379]|uniref:hypothetical protein n=1 Tax=Paludibacterium sp. THUN1379 TaxID=3112107 RepID=UPI00308E1105|nr:hypothetical protein THUN1379_10420 [Paludibacterium sp. THUN1379]